MNGSVTYEGNTLLNGAINVNAGGNIEALNVQVTENGTRTITASQGVDGYSPITIETNVPIPGPVLISKTITENGTYTPPTGTDGYNEVSVNIPGPVLISKTITENGTYTPPTGTDGYNEVSVNIPGPVLISKTITENGTYTPGVGTDGYNEVIVNVQPSAPTYNIIADKKMLVNTSGVNQGWVDFDTQATDGKSFLVLLYDQNQASVMYPIVARFKANFAQYPTNEVYVQGSQNFRIDIKSTQMRLGGSNSKGLVVTLIELPDSMVQSPF